MPDVKHFDPSAVIGAVTQLLWQRGWADTGIADIVDTTGISRSSLYATFGSKQDLCLAALHRYLAEHAAPAFAALENGGRGLPTIAEFFGGLITARCTGPRARWGCLATNLQTNGTPRDEAFRDVLTEHHRRVRDALRTALGSANGLGQLRPDLDLDTAAEHLVLVAQGVNLRSRAGADASTLRSAVAAALNALRRPGDTTDTWPR
ncbi:TetR family transcriptional regulator [Amycolatopsis echigonensis]|uniref:TetR family transcriptional regulator n=2 Tax=Pseudonocardiaceae TaxID=2070 RepID=A0A2N3WJM0_9PSEU|nr:MULTISPECIES: TetR/AcrR family transcriptional regulator [Pseudonocardiaceae]AEA23538.1 regulatory protein TetR [Pseudonocardia dioxanivorans CB1190]PKV94052.1 TetR family transcriptional regulator [Amycolatopsis niigatensis]